MENEEQQRGEEIQERERGRAVQFICNQQTNKSTNRFSCVTKKYRVAATWDALPLSMSSHSLLSIISFSLPLRVALGLSVFLLLFLAQQVAVAFMGRGTAYIALIELFLLKLFLFVKCVFVSVSVW